MILKKIVFCAVLTVVWVAALIVAMPVGMAWIVCQVFEGE